MDKKSFIRGIVRYAIILMALLVMVLVLYSTLSVINLRNEVAQSSGNFLQLYGNDLRSKVSQADRMLRNIITQNAVNLILLKSENETTRYHATQSIFNFMLELMRNDRSADMICVADNTFGVILNADSNSIRYADRLALRAFTYENTASPEFVTDWRFVTINEKTYICKMYTYDGRTVAAYLEAAPFLYSVPAGDFGNQTIVLSDAQKQVYAVRGLPADSWTIGDPVSSFAPGGSFVLSYDIIPGQIAVNSIVSISLWSQLRAGTIAAILMILLSLAISIFLIRYVKREIIKPMHLLTEGMSRINLGEYDLRMSGECKTREFSLLQRTFNRLMDEIIGLKLKNSLKMIELQDAELKSIRLQIKPHFFLNAMSTISSLSSQGKDKQIRTFIDALSKNIRYMFKSGLHTVPLREELRHVENYLEMQELKYPGCVFHFIEAEDGLADWRVPQMLIHTFIENEFKHAISVSSTLTILIKAFRGISGGEDVLVLEIEDDGQGYPPEILAVLNSPEAVPPADGLKIGLWSIKRMMELMYEKQGLVTFGNAEPHGCLNRIFIPVKPVHELQQEPGASNASFNSR